MSRERLFAFISPLSLLLLWELMSRTGVLDQRIFSRPTSVAVLMWMMLTNGQLARDTGATLARLFVGTVIGTLPGLVLGLTIGLFRTPRAVVNPLISVTYGLPRVALFPLVLLIVGLNEASNVIMVALGPFFTMVIGTAAAVQNVDPIYLKVARSFNVGPRDLYLKVVLPAALPIIFSAFRVSLGLALLGVVAVEFLMTNNGLGYLIWHSWQILSLGQSMVGLVTTGVIAYALFLILDRIQRRALPGYQRTSIRPATTRGFEEGLKSQVSLRRLWAGPQHGPAYSKTVELKPRSAASVQLSLCLSMGTGYDAQSAV